MPEDSLYEAAYQALLNEGVPVSIAERAAKVVASDGVPLNRSPEQQKDVTDAWIWMCAKRNQNENISEDKV